MTDHNLPNGYRWATEEEWERFASYAEEQILGAQMTPIVYTPEGRIYTDRSLLHLAVLDQRNDEILRTRMELLNRRPGPRVGDFVEFADGVMRRFSHNWDEAGLQTSDGGSWHLGNSGMSFSGSLHPCVQREDIKQTDEMRWGSAWFFSHDHWTAHNAVHVQIPLRVFKCNKTSKER